MLKIYGKQASERMYLELEVVWGFLLPLGNVDGDDLEVHFFL